MYVCMCVCIYIYIYIYIYTKKGVLTEKVARSVERPPLARAWIAAGVTRGFLTLFSGGTTCLTLLV